MVRPHIIAIIAAALLSTPAQSQELHLTQGSWSNVENLTLEMFFATRSSGSLILHGTCENTFDGRDVVSDTVSNLPDGTFKNLADGLTELSHREPHVSWTRDKSGSFQVIDDRAVSDILQLRLACVRFKGAVTPTAAIRDLMSTPEIRAYLADNRIEEGTMFEHAGPVTTEGLPQLSGELRDVTVAQALDRIVRFFPGLWIFSECSDGSVKRVRLRGAIVSWPGETKGQDKKFRPR